ncbi:MAG: cation-translocating P-type ATPase [Microthrixaceae bacterium]
MTGLTASQAAERLAADGPNVLPSVSRTPAWRRLGAQLVHFFAVMLWVAAALAVIAGMPELGVAIVAIVIVNGVFAFAQEQRAERASTKLLDLLPAKVLVHRDGVTVEVTASGVVAGDLVVLAAGDRVVADMTAVEAHDLELDESTLTGESDPIAVRPGDGLWAGSFVVSGEGTAEVQAIGANTRLGDIARMTGSATRPPGPLAVELRRIVRTMSVVTIGAGVAFFVLTRFTGMPARDGFLFAVGVTVALVPEGLLPTLTLSLAMGAQRMAHRNALVRHLQAVETLGSTTFICTDKTGTLTRNEMTVVQVWTPVGSVDLAGTGYGPDAVVSGDPTALTAAARVARAARASSRGRATLREGEWVPMGDPMEAAIDTLCRRLDPGGSTDPVATRRFPFDPRRRRASAVIDGDLLVKGAPDSVLPRCAPEPAATAAMEALAAHGLRVIAVAHRDSPPIDDTSTADDAEHDLALLGLIALQDPPRAEVPAALLACRAAGVKVAMVTGDHPSTAGAIAQQIGLSPGAPMVVVGDDLPEDDEALGELLDRDGVVVSRATPAHKLRIARALQLRGHVVAMTGDGVNDGPALREADIGVAMGRSGTDVAREAADLVLLDDDFATIVAAIEEGRATFTNIRRFLTYHLTDNVAELTPFAIWGLSGGRFPLAIGVLQILCLDIVTDLLPALALGAEPPSPGLLSRPISGRHLIDASLLWRVFGVLGPTEAMVEMTAFLAGLLAAGWRPGAAFPTGAGLLAASGAAFAAVVMGQVGNAQACRSATRPPQDLGWTTNRLLNVALVVQVGMLAALLWVPAFADVLGQASPPVGAGLIAVGAAPAVLLADGAHKALRRRRSAAWGQSPEG